MTKKDKKYLKWWKKKDDPYIAMWYSRLVRWFKIGKKTL